MDLDIEGYARVMAELAAAGPARSGVLQAHGLDEDRWSVIDVAWQERLSEALDATEEGVPALLSVYAGAYEKAQRALAPPISLELFARVTVLVQASGDLHAALARTGVTLAAYVGGSEHWSRRLVEDPALARRFEELLHAD